MSHIKLIIFDLDGTTADTLDGICEAVNRTMRELGYPLHTRQSVQGFVNYGVEQFCREMLPPACIPTGSSPSTMAAPCRSCGISSGRCG